VTNENGARASRTGHLGRLAGWRPRSVLALPANQRVDAGALEVYLAGLGPDAGPTRRLIEAIDGATGSLSSLSRLTAPLALEYLDRLHRPIPALTSETGVQIVSRSYLAHMIIEGDPEPFGAEEVPVVDLPPLRRGHPPQDLLTRVVKATRRRFERIRAVPEPVWNGLVRDLVYRAHARAPDADPGDLLSLTVVDALARFGWVLRQVDQRYGLEPERG
jgi:hypothetical protein